MGFWKEDIEANCLLKHLDLRFKLLLEYIDYTVDKKIKLYQNADKEFFCLYDDDGAYLKANRGKVTKLNLPSFNQWLCSNRYGSLVL